MKSEPPEKLEIRYADGRQSCKYLDRLRQKMFVDISSKSVPHLVDEGSIDGWIRNRGPDQKFTWVRVERVEN
jgi:hypothetical protein